MQSNLLRSSWIYVLLNLNQDRTHFEILDVLARNIQNSILEVVWKLKKTMLYWSTKFWKYMQIRKQTCLHCIRDQLYFTSFSSSILLLVKLIAHNIQGARFWKVMKVICIEISCLVRDFNLRVQTLSKDYMSWRQAVTRNYKNKASYLWVDRPPYRRSDIENRWPRYPQTSAGISPNM